MANNTHLIWWVILHYLFCICVNDNIKVPIIDMVSFLRFLLLSAFATCTFYLFQFFRV
jgi:hypothetical protein